MGAFVDACNLSMTRFNNYKVDSFERVLEPLVNIDFEHHRGTNQQAIKELSDAIRDAIAINHKISEDLF